MLKSTQHAVSLAKSKVSAMDGLGYILRKASTKSKSSAVNPLGRDSFWSFLGSFSWRVTSAAGLLMMTEFFVAREIATLEVRSASQ
ncbi:MAG: hypothetical protein CMM87_00395 [Rickettsiales bacterium]|nr:hypothetical protein [Rickettsiales bacterium]